MDVQRRSQTSFVVVNRAQRGQPDPFFDKSRNVWVALWRKADGRTGRPTGRTRAAAEATRDRHVAAELESFGHPMAWTGAADLGAEAIVGLQGVR